MAEPIFDRQEALDYVRSQGETVLLSFSGGKDSLTAWVYLEKCGFTVVPFYMAICPGLAFVEQSLAYYEEFFQTHITRTIHPNFYLWMQTMGLQTPERSLLFQWMKIPSFTFEQVETGVARSHGLNHETMWTAVGARMVDSLNRRLTFRKHGVVNYTARKFQPIADMKKDEMIMVLKERGVKLGVDYWLFGRSFDGLDHRYLKPIKEHFPEDYERIKRWFPLADLEFARKAVYERHYHHGSTQGTNQKKAG